MSSHSENSPPDVPPLIAGLLRREAYPHPAAAAIGAVGAMPSEAEARPEPPALSDSLPEESSPEASPGDDASADAYESDITTSDDGFGGGYMPSDVDVIGGGWDQPATDTESTEDEATDGKA